MEKRPALGKGLSALIPDAPEPRAAPARGRHRSPVAERLSAARAGRRRAARGARAVDHVERRHPADRRPQGRRSLSDHRGRAPLARRAAAPACCACRSSSRDVAAGQRAVAARDGAHREHPARESESDRRGARVPPADRRIPADAGRHRDRGRQGPRDGRQLPAAAEAARRGARRGRRRARCRWATRARCSRSPTRPISAASRATSSRAACRCARPSRWSRRSPKARRRRASRRRPSRSDVHTRAAEDRLRLALGTRVRIVRQGTRGRIEIDFASEDELIRIYEQLTDAD